jgi:phospholipid/cholesterol/gamma-HCH transport system substrate-binding protein
LKISDETKVGIMAAFGIAIMIIGYSFLKGNNIFDKSVKLYAVYDRVDGLTKSSAVVVNGYGVGRIGNITMRPDGKLVAEIKITDETVRIPKNSTAKLVSLDFLGTRAVQIIFADEVNGYVVTGDTLVSALEPKLADMVNEQIAPLKTKAEGLISSIDTVMSVVQGILGNNSINNSLTNVESATARFSILAKHVDSLLLSEMQSIQGIIRNLEGVLAIVKRNGDNLDSTFANLNHLTGSLAESDIKGMITTLDSTLNEAKLLLKQINEGEGTVGLLIHDRTVYDNLEKATIDLDSLLLDFKESPGRYIHFSVFGRSDKPKTPKK